MGLEKVLPHDLPWELQLLFWLLLVIISLLFGMCLWWLARFIKSHDEFKDGVNKNLKENTETVNRAVRRIEETSMTFEKTATSLKLETEKAVLAVHQRVAELGATIEIAKNKVEMMGGSVENLGKTMQHHNDALKLAGDVFRSHGETLQTHGETLKSHGDTLGRQSEAIRTIIKKWGHNSMLVTSDKKKSDTGDGK